MSTATISIIDDEPLGLAMATDEGAGFEVAADGGAENAFPYSMNGRGLARAVTERWPHGRIVRTSGYSLDNPVVMPLRSTFLAPAHLSKAREAVLPQHMALAE